MMLGEAGLACRSLSGFEGDVTLADTSLFEVRTGVRASTEGVSQVGGGALPSTHGELHNDCTL